MLIWGLFYLGFQLYTVYTNKAETVETTNDQGLTGLNEDNLNLQTLDEPLIDEPPPLETVEDGL